MFLKRYDFFEKFLIDYQMVYLEKMYIRLFNLADNQYYTMYFFALLIYVFCFLFFISFRSDLNSVWSFFASARLILSSLILSKKLKTLSNLLSFSSAVEPLHLYYKSSELTFLSNLVISSSFSFTSLLNISFCFEINELSLSLWAYFLIVLISPWF